MKIKLLRRLCADEVKLLLERMDSNFEEFQDDNSKWEPLLPRGDGFRLFTRIEQHCIRSEYRAHLEKYKKAQAYQEILERAMSPSRTIWEYREAKEGLAKKEAEPKKMLISRAQYEMAHKLLQQQAQFIPPQPSTLLDPYTQHNLKQ
jgi:hypothetical protein